MVHVIKHVDVIFYAQRTIGQPLVVFPNMLEDAESQTNVTTQ